MDKVIKYYTTSEFANLCGVNKKTLFHYDEINLLKPEKISSNGYRYYSANQLDLFTVISILKDLEMPLKEIINFIDSRTAERTIDLFTNEKKIIEDKIKHFKRMQQVLDIKLKIIEEAKNCSSKITIEEQDEETIVLSDSVRDTEDLYDVNTFADHVKYCTKNKLNYGYSIGCIIKKKALINHSFIQPDGFIAYDYYFTKLPNLKMYNKYLKKPKGSYVTGYHFGYWDTISKIYTNLIDFIKKNDLVIDGDAYEEILIDDVVTKNTEDFVFKVSIKIKNYNS